VKTPKPQKGTWKLIAPDGREFKADTPIHCLLAEQKERVPAKIAMKRIFNAIGLGDNVKESTKAL